MKKILAGVLLVSALVLPGQFQKKVSASGGTPTNAVCSPISSLSVKGDGITKESGFGSVQMSWSAKPCDKAQTIRVTSEIDNWTTKAVLYQDANALLSGKAMLYVPNYQLYEGKITVFDSATGDVLATQSYVVSTRPKGF